jgi:hypothetical protein
MSVLTMFLIGAGGVLVGVLICVFREKLLSFFSLGWESMGSVGKNFAQNRDASDLLPPAIALILVGSGFLLSGILRVVQSFGV